LSGYCSRRWRGGREAGRRAARPAAAELSRLIAQLIKRHLHEPRQAEGEACHQLKIMFYTTKYQRTLDAPVCWRSMLEQAATLVVAWQLLPHY